MREVREFSVVDVLGAGLRAYVQGARLYLPLLLVSVVAVFAMDELSGFNQVFDERLAEVRPGEPLSPPTAAYWHAVLLSTLLGLVLYSLFEAGLAYGIVRSLRGGEMTAGELWGQALRLLPRVALILVASTAATGVGMFFLIIPGALIWLMLSVAVPVGVVERCGTLRALKRSAELTSGHKVPLFGLLLLYVFVLGTLWVAAGQTQEQGLGGELAYQLLGSLIGGAASAVLAAAYHDLRILKESTRRGESLAA